ncbi:hypothetical protein ACP70R_025347 [Stipagrostis hirtigluma subsp. patula]
MSAAATASRGMRALAVLGRCVRAPFRVLVRARDLYSHVFYRPAGAAGEDDVRELIRASRLINRPAGVGPRSQSVAVGRIDEGRPCEFGLEDEERAQALGPRSRSCAVGPSARTARRVGFAA